VFDDQTLPDFLIVSLLLGGGAAMLTGRALALAWRPAWVGLLWMLPLAAAVRFVHFVLFQSELFSPGPYAVDLLVLWAAVWFGHRLTRAGQMTDRYPWAIAPVGRLSWRLKSPPAV